MSEGIKHDAGKPATGLLPFDALLDVAAVLEYGRKKYTRVEDNGRTISGERNWELGMAWGRLLGAALRHLFAWARGAELDEESGLPHLAHASCCVLMLTALVKRRVGTDDRFFESPAPAPAPICEKCGFSLAIGPSRRCRECFADGTDKRITPTGAGWATGVPEDL